MDASRTVPHKASPAESITPISGRIHSVDTDRYNGPPILDGPLTGVRGTMESPVGYHSAMPILHEGAFHLPTGSGTSPASSGSYSLRGGEGMTGRRASDVNTPAADEEVNLEALWQSARGDGAPDSTPRFQAYPLGAPKTMPTEASSYGMYSAFM